MKYVTKTSKPFSREFLQNSTMVFIKPKKPEAQSDIAEHWYTETSLNLGLVEFNKYCKSQEKQRVIYLKLKELRPTLIIYFLVDCTTTCADL